jgi:hypothetical protein
MVFFEEDYAKSDSILLCGNNIKKMSPVVTKPVTINSNSSKVLSPFSGWLLFLFLSSTYL